MGIPYTDQTAAERIVELARVSNDGLVTYQELWKSFHPRMNWGTESLREVMEILDVAIHYCATVPAGPLPVITTLVVQRTPRTISQAAKTNIFNAAQRMGYHTGSDVEAFYKAQLDGAMRLIAKGHP